MHYAHRNGPKPAESGCAVSIRFTMKRSADTPSRALSEGLTRRAKPRVCQHLPQLKDADGPAWTAHGMPMVLYEDQRDRARVAGETLVLGNESRVPPANESQTMSGFPTDALQEGNNKELDPSS